MLFDFLGVGSHVLKLLFIDHQKLTCLIVLLLKLSIFYPLCAKLKL